MKYIILLLIFVSCEFRISNSIRESDPYYLTETYFEHESFFWKDSIYPASLDRFGYYIWLPDDDGKYYRKIYCNDLIYMKINLKQH